MLRGTLGVVAGLALPASPTLAEKKNGPGVTDTEIKIGTTNQYRCNASAYGQNGRSEAAYYLMINDQGGVNRRKIVYISLDDSYNPPKTVALTRQLVERDQVLLVGAPLGTAPNIAIQKYLNQKKVQQLFVGSAPPAETIRRISRGPLAGTPATTRKGSSMPSTS